MCFFQLRWLIEWGMFSTKLILERGWEIQVLSTMDSFLKKLKINSYEGKRSPNFA